MTQRISSIAIKDDVSKDMFPANAWQTREHTFNAEWPLLSPARKSRIVSSISRGSLDGGIEGFFLGSLEKMARGYSRFIIMPEADTVYNSQVYVLVYTLAATRAMHGTKSGINK